jgi:hypothetical protein
MKQQSSQRGWQHGEITGLASDVNHSATNSPPKGNLFFRLSHPWQLQHTGFCHPNKHYAWQT